MRSKRTLAPLLLSVAALAGCGDRAREAPPGAVDPIVGRWVYDRSTAPDGVSDAEKARLDELLRVMPKMSIEYAFAADGTFTLEEQAFSREASHIEGRWTSGAGGYVVTETTRNGGPRRTDGRTNSIEVRRDGDELTFHPPGAPVVFHLRRR